MRDVCKVLSERVVRSRARWIFHEGRFCVNISGQSVVQMVEGWCCGSWGEMLLYRGSWFDNVWFVRAADEIQSIVELKLCLEFDSWFWQLEMDWTQKQPGTYASPSQPTADNPHLHPSHVHIILLPTKLYTAYICTFQFLKWIFLHCKSNTIHFNTWTFLRWIQECRRWRFEEELMRKIYLLGHKEINVFDGKLWVHMS